MNISELAGHVKDSQHFHVPAFVWKYLPEFMQAHEPGYVALPSFGTVQVFGRQIELQLTKFMVLEVVAAVLILVIFILLGRRLTGGRPPRGRFWNLFEAMLVFVRDEVARPAIGRHEADRFLPFIWTIFFFILFCNLLGLVPWAGSPTGSVSVTGALALVTLTTVFGSGMKKYGLVGFWTGLVPQMDLPLVLAVLLKPMLLGIEVMGLVIKHGVLAVRLLANMFAGHLVLAVIIMFIGATARSSFVVWAGVTLGSVLGAAALSLLELFVAFLQAYVFTFLAAVFIGMAVHQH